MVFDPFRSKPKNILVNGMLCKNQKNHKGATNQIDMEKVARCGALRELSKTKVTRLGPQFVIMVHADPHPTFTKSQILKYIQQGVDAGFKLPKGFNNTNLKTKPKSHLNYIAALVETYFETMPIRDGYTHEPVKVTLPSPRTFNAAGKYIREHVLKGHGAGWMSNGQDFINGWKRDPNFHRQFGVGDVFREAGRLANKHKDRNMFLNTVKSNQK